MMQAVKLARKKWATIESDKLNRCFEVTSEQPMMPDSVDWADGEFTEVMAQAFQGRIICTRKDAMTNLRKPPRREYIEDYES